MPVEEIKLHQGLFEEIPMLVEESKPQQSLFGETPMPVKEIEPHGFGSYFRRSGRDKNKIDLNGS